MTGSDEPAGSGNDPEIRSLGGDSAPPPGNGAGDGAESGTGDGAESGTGDGGLSWSFEFDLAGVLAGLGRPVEGGGEADQEEVLAAELAARDGGEGVLVDLAGVVAEGMPAGPGLAAWLSQLVPEGAADRDLAGLAAAFRRVASWAQAGELAMVAQVAARSAARDERIGLAADGRPAWVSRDAAAQVSLELALSACGGEAWAQLAVTLRWRLPSTAAALAAGDIDLYRAKVIAEGTGVLAEDAARAVEGKVLPGAGEMTYGQLHAAVRRAVIAADPEGAERRREASERRAGVRLYPDEDHTATLAGVRLPAVQAAAAMARLSAMAAALRASGAGGGIDFLRAYVFLGSLTGTLPPIPPSADGPPDNDPPPEGAPGYDPPGDHDPPPEDRPDGGGGPGGAGPGPGRGPSPGGGRRGAGDPPAGDPRPGAGPAADGPVPPRGSQGGPRHRGNAGPPGNADPPDAGPPGNADPPGGGGPPGSAGQPAGTGPPGDAGASSHPGAPDSGGPADVPCVDPWPDLPALSDADAPEDDGFAEPPLAEDCLDGAGRFRGDPLEDHHAKGEVVPAWPPVPVTVPAPPASAAGTAGAGRPPPGLLDLSLPWATLTCESASPGTLTRIGPVTATRARRLARVAAGEPGTQWRLILTGEDQHAIAVTRLPRISAPAELNQPGLTGLVGRVTVIMPAIAAPDRAPPGHPRDDPILIAILRAAVRARDGAAQLARADHDAPGGCAHTAASPAYRPPPRLRDYITARDLTCRYPYCGQPAWRGDLDHTRPWDKGGPTCRCNLGGLCRAHHILKHHPGWTLTQPRPGVFQWTTPAGRTYTVTPDIQPS